MIKALQSILQHHAPAPRVAPGKPRPTGPSDVVSLGKVPKHRDPKEAVAFVKKLDRQLGLSQEMTREKHRLMSQDSHTFFRVVPALFYHDLQSTYLERSRLLPEPAPRVGIVGDAHVLNVGTFRSPEGKVVWGLNDFDQAEVGSPEWDLERLGVSLYVAARSGGVDKKEALELVRQMGSSYLKNLGKEGPAFLTAREAGGEIKDLIEDAGEIRQSEFLAEWTSKDGRELDRNPDLIEPDKERKRKILGALSKKFPNLTVLDLASKPHSGGSTRGLERYYALVDSSETKPWILEVKAVLPSPVQIPDGDLSRGDGDKVLSFAKAMGSPVDHRHKAFRLGDVAFFTREREREKDALKGKPKELRDMAAPLGKVLARAHNASQADIEGWVGGRDQQLLDNLEGFVETYARQVESDFREFSAKRPP